MARHNCEKQGCPKGTDLRTCKKALAGECPFLVTKGGTGLYYTKRQQELFK